MFLKLFSNFAKISRRELTKKMASPQAAITNVLTKFHEHLTKTVTTFFLLTRFNYSHIQTKTIVLTKFYKDWTMYPYRINKGKNATPTDGHVFQPTGTIFELITDIIRTNWTKMKNAPPPLAALFFTNHNHYWTIHRKNALPPCGHVFQQIRAIFQVIQDNIRTNILTKFHEHWTTNVTS
ncbi:hypothetical protein DPMN_059372 [Dreissena polymorpha]|uniref:Uncharacterized protein n=1 Tax=Dreissena polymorpha TaxID=45954 RepID=A0A9D4HH66_DREPO|nr:hypothetical protein DPMN_059372 [Dreissena polymorpha]